MGRISVCNVQEDIVRLLKDLTFKGPSPYGVHQPSQLVSSRLDMVVYRQLFTNAGFRDK